nr:hypothetical protein [uncultured Campylobacter sp.]
MSGFLNFACGAAHSRSPRGILLLAVLNPCAARGILPRVLSARTACGEASRLFASLSLKQNFGFEILKQVLKFISALAFFGRNFCFKIYARRKFKDGLQKRSCLTSPIAASTAVPPSSAATLPTTLPALAALPVSTRAQASALVQTQASTPPSEQIRARAQAKFKSAIFKFAASQSTVAKRAISKFTKFTIFSLAALKFKNGPLAQRRALV